MANSRQATKRARQAERRRRRNAAAKSSTRTYLKKTSAAIASGDADLSGATFQQAKRVLDKMAGRGVIHKNKAARHKSRLNKKIKQLAAPPG